MNQKEIERWHRLRNIKRAAQVLVIATVALVVSGYVALIIFPDQDPAKSFVAKPIDPNAGMSIEGFSYSSPGAHPWELEAASAVASESLDKVSLGRPRVVYHGGLGGKIFLTADKGNLDKKSNNVIANGNVTIRYEDFVFTTGDINYSQDKKTAETDSAISMQGTDFHLEGKGLKMSVRDEEIVIEQDVRARLLNVRWLEPGKVPM